MLAAASTGGGGGGRRKAGLRRQETEGGHARLGAQGTNTLDRIGVTSTSVNRKKDNQRQRMHREGGGGDEGPFKRPEASNPIAPSRMGRHNTATRDNRRVKQQSSRRLIW